MIVGKRGWLYDDFFAGLEGSPTQEAVIFPGYVPDADLPAIYTGAQALVLPSLYEGFGLPILEAMGCGTPVVCSRTSSLPEVAGDAGILIDPGDSDDLAAGIARVIQDSVLRQELMQRGLSQAARFSWQRTAQETLAVYRQVTHSHLSGGNRP